MILFWILGILAVIWLVRELGLLDAWSDARRGGRSPGSRSGDDESLRILRERFARGEIDAAEFQARREALESPGES